LIAAAMAGAALCAAAVPAQARDLPVGGLTVAEVQSWLQTAGYAAKVETNSDGTQDIASSSDGANFHVFFYDCKNKRCASMQFSAGFDTKGAFNATKMNQWDVDKRWTRAYADKVNDPWLEYDVDLAPGGTFEGLDDQFGIWRQSLGEFRKYIGW
jgi:hypothetical protein